MILRAWRWFLRVVVGVTPTCKESYCQAFRWATCTGGRCKHHCDLHCECALIHGQRCTDGFCDAVPWPSCADGRCKYHCDLKCKCVPVGKPGALRVIDGGTKE